MEGRNLFLTGGGRERGKRKAKKKKKRRRKKRSKETAFKRPKSQSSNQRQGGRGGTCLTGILEFCRRRKREGKNLVKKEGPRGRVPLGK